jgi:hypothetical protein
VFGLSRQRRRPRSASAWLVLLLCLVGLGTSAGASPASAATTSANDPFYVAPANLASLANGEAIRSRRVQTRGLPRLPFAYKSWQILFRTNDGRGKPVAVATTIMLPLKRPAKNRKLISYQLAYNGLAPTCQPSYILQTGEDLRVDPETLLIQHALFSGWTVVTTDFEGPDSQYMNGLMAGQATLDGIRAAENFEPVGLDDRAATPVGLIGYSGGAQPTAWANELAPSYAPELNIKGASIGGTPANPEMYMRFMSGEVPAGIAFAALEGIMRAYPEVNYHQYLNQNGKNTMRRIGAKCLSQFVFSDLFRTFTMLTKKSVPDLLAVPEIRAVLRANTLGQRRPAAPVLMTHAMKDETIDFEEIQQLADTYCSMGVPLQFVASHINEHVDVAIHMAGRAFAYLRQRFSGAPAPNTCPGAPPTGPGPGAPAPAN